ncbi:hypothetical protein [Lacinutrix salivirga]
MSKKIKIIVALILLALGFIVFLDNGVRYNFYVLLLNYTIIVFTTYQIFSSKSLPFSLHKITNLFFLFFIGISPALQYKKDVFFMGEKSHLTTTNFIFGNLIFLATLILYTLLYYYFSNKSSYKNNGALMTAFKTCTSTFKNSHIFTISILSILVVFGYFEFNLEAVFSRKVLWLEIDNYSTPMVAIFNVIRGVPLIMLLYFKLNGKKNTTLEVVLLILIVISNFPTGISRYRVAATFLPLCLIYIKPFLRKNYFTAFFIISFLVVFPYLHHFRYNDDLFVNPFNFNMFTELDFDSYQNSLNIIVNDIITNGQQFLGTIFFYIPSVYWESKPIGSSYVLANALEYDGFSNVAIGFFAEGYINFGYIGIALFTILLAKINSYCDMRFWFNTQKESYFTIIYLFLIPFEFLILRGSLRASFANLCGYLFFTLLLFFILRKTSKIKAF